jgi:hypothetical protein
MKSVLGGKLLAANTKARNDVPVFLTRERLLN